VNISGGGAFATSTQNHTVSFTKTAGSDIEIGVINTNGKSIRVSQVYAVITYTPPATPTPTPTPTPNTAPTITSANDDPDPIEAGNDITFSVDWNDVNAEGVEMFICTTNSINIVGPACGASSWCENSGSFSLTDPSVCNYTAQVADEGLNNYYAFVCDDEISCSAGTAGTFTVTVPVVNVPPTITSVTDNPDPVTTGNPVTFSVDWSDGNGEGVKMFICKTNSINTVTPSCTGGSWCSNSSSFSFIDPSECLYVTQPVDEGANNYYAFVCDDEISCSAGTAGTFTASAAATPTPTPTPTATPTPEPPVIEYVTTGGGNSPAKIIFNGEVFPGANVSLFLMGDEYGQAQIGDAYNIGDDGKFLIEAISPVEEERFYSLFVKDSDNVPLKSKFFQYDLEFNTIVRQKDLIFAPTININKTKFARNEIMLVSGYAAPGNAAELIVDGQKTKTINVESDGLFRIDVNTNDLTLGTHNVQTRQVDDETGKISDYSPTKRISLGLFGSIGCDLNDDSGVSISDWSIFLLNWLGGTAETKVKVDLNGDGEIGIEDFSLFLQCWRLNN
jgi:hypothetical protein